MRKLIAGFLTITLSMLICTLIFSFGASKICIDTLSSTVVNKQIASKTVDTVKELYPNVSNDTLEKIETAVKNSDEINEITEIYFNSIIKDYGKGTNVKAPNIKPQVQILINEAASFLNEEQKNEIISLIDDENKFSSIYEWSFDNLTDDQREAIGLYKFAISDNFKYILGGLILLNIILLMIVLKSLYKWMLDVSISCIISGLVILLAIPKLLSSVSKKIMASIVGTSNSININAINNYGYLLLLVGVVLLMFYLLFRFIEKKRTHE